ncbi:MAG: class III lanthionine synthetase LanKC [Actinobacteria bacterium]|nr:class III lanthionine synthetase LanKC [Actinomycetota bacterium]
MDKGYELYCLTDAEFYDSSMLATVKDEPFEIATRELPPGWRSAPSDDWLMFAPEGVELPMQGWKIHASACMDNAEGIVETIYEYCVRERVAFKFIRSPQLLFLRNTKYAHRGYSGKFVTIFPADDEQFARILEDLAPALDGHESPYILSDLRWGSGPLYVRYGGFVERFCVGPDGELEAAIENADGELVPDRRGATFQVPRGIELPQVLVAHLEARNSDTLGDLPYRPEHALHFSNGGGVYLGVDTRTGEQIVLKEARPHAGLDSDARDAVARLTRERDTMQQLAGLNVTPALRDHFVVGGHHFLVMDYITGEPLAQRIVARYPLICPDPDAQAIDEFTTWALGVCARLDEAVAAAHERGIVLGDLHPSNVLVEDDGRIVLIDLEIASHVSESLRPALADPGFGSPSHLTGFAIDDYALACLRLFIFLPLTRLIPRDPAKTRQLASEIALLFPKLPSEFLAEAVEVISDARPPLSSGSAAGAPRSLQPDAAGWELARDSMAAAILASATPSRDDRLFPGDPKQFHTNGLNLAYGAAGVLYALGLNLAHFAAQAGDSARWRQAVGIAEILADRLGDEDAVAQYSGGDQPYAGLLRGSSGPALLFVRLYEHFRDPILLDLAHTALSQDLRRCIVRDDGAMDVNEGWRTMPYLADGSIGIGMVLADYLAHREDERFATAAQMIRRTARCGFYIEPGLFWGRAGMILHLSRGQAAPERDPIVATHVRRLGWHAMSYRGNLAFPGEELLRLSMDLATGTAGVLLALGAALHDQPVELPFLAAPVGAERDHDLVLTTSEGR